MTSGLPTAGRVAGELDRLAADYGRLVTAVSYFDALRISLARQVANYSWWRARSGLGDVLELHQGQLETASLELDLLVVEGQRPLEAARTTVELVRAALDRQQERAQRVIQTLLAIAGAALAVPQLIDRTAAGALLGLFGVPTPEGGHPVLVLTLAQFSITAAVALLAACLVLLLGASHRGR
jgi:hypothetical protein